jgi:AraC-like DNA-binding protein
MRVLGKYALVLLREGGGRYRDANGIDCRVQAGDALLLCPELAHSYGPGPGERWSETYVVFEGRVFDLWRECGLLDSAQPVLHLDAPEQWHQALELLVAATRPVTAAERALEISRLIGILTEITAAAAVEQSAAAGQWLAEACTLLGSDLESAIDLAGVARQLGLSYEAFRKLFQRGSGTSPARFRAGRVIDAACGMMQHEGLSNKEIAGRLGFSDEFHFSKRFKQITGMAPREFRRQLPRLG